MIDPWQEYLSLTEELAGLAEVEARGVADAKAAYAAEDRRLQNQLAIAERELKELQARNTRLQVKVRDLVRAVGATTPPETSQEPIPPDQLGDAMHAAEYDLAQLERRVENLQQQLAAPPPAPAPAAPRPAPPSRPEFSTPEPPAQPRKSLLPYIAAAVAVALVAFLVAFL